MHAAKNSASRAMSETCSQVVSETRSRVVSEMRSVVSETRSRVVSEMRSDAVMARRRAERFDMLVASMVLLALIFGWVIRFAPPEQWPRGDFFVASAARHA
jgi:hypothetical protein